jgi:predicted Zn-ribbon and HTH transcriptional regulator
MSQEYCILNLLNIEDENVKLIENFYKIEKNFQIKYKVIKATLSYNPVYCHRCGCIFDKEQTYEKTALKYRIY